MSGAGARVTPVVVVTNGCYARELVEAAEVMAGPVQVRCVECPCALPPELVRSRLRRAVTAALEGQVGPALLLVDLVGSTQANVCLELVRENAGWDVVTGLNLPMLLKLATCDRSESPTEIAGGLKDTGCRSVQVGTELIEESAHRGD